MLKCQVRRHTHFHQNLNKKSTCNNLLFLITWKGNLSHYENYLKTQTKKRRVKKKKKSTVQSIQVLSTFSPDHCLPMGPDVVHSASWECCLVDLWVRSTDQWGGFARFPPLLLDLWRASPYFMRSFRRAWSGRERLCDVCMHMRWCTEDWNCVLVYVVCLWKRSVAHCGDSLRELLRGWIGPTIQPV